MCFVREREEKKKCFEGNDGKRKLMIIEGPGMHGLRTKMMKKKTKTYSLSLSLESLLLVLD